MDFKIFTYCTEHTNPIFKKLTKNLEINLLPILTDWTWDFYPKSLSTYQTLKNIDGETIVLICDAYDVLPVYGVTNDSLFTSIKKNFNLEKITFNAEKNCYPNEELKKIYPKVSTDWKYLNGGIYVGKTKNIVNMLENLLPKMKGIIDQEVFSKCYVNNEYDIEIDYNCNVFQTLYMLNEDDLFFNNGLVINNKTNTTPLLIHANGKSSLEKFLNYEK